MNGIELLKKHCHFETQYDCYVLLAVSRKKDTPELTNSKEIVFREVIKNESDIEKKYLRIKSMVNNFKDIEGKSYPFYIYVSLNRRDAKKATFLYLNKILGWVQEEINGIDRSRHLKKLYGEFYSVLMMKESRSTGQKYFMIDYDEKEPFRLNSFLEVLKNREVGYEFVQETRNGSHIKLKPFDRRVLEDIKHDFEIKIDANFFVEYVENEQPKNGSILYGEKQND